MDRRDWYFRQRVTEAELGEAQDKIEIAIDRIVQEIIGFGFLSGASVIQHAPTADLTVDIGTFLGYDQLGRRLNLPVAGAPQVLNMAVDEVGAPTAVSSGGNEKTLAVFVEFDRVLSDPRLDGNGSTVFWKVDETFKLNVVQSAEAPIGTSVPPPLRTNQILITDAVIIFSQTQILNADIDQSRREDFTFSGFLHGASHRELGADPVPNATPADGGIMSGVDKTKLDTVSWTGGGVAALLGLIARPVQPANVTAPSATSLIVTTEMVAHGSPAGGSPSVKGVVTVVPNNRVILKNTDLDDFLDGSAESNKVYGRLTEAAGIWTLSFYSFKESGAGETAFNMTPFAAQSIQWWPQETFGLDSYPTFDPSFSVPSDQLAGEVPDGDAAGIKGKVEFAPHGNTDALKAVQGSDPRLTGSGALQLIRKLASRPSLIFYPHDALVGSNNAYNTYRLHQFHGLARGDVQAGGSEEPADFYFEYDRGNANYPLDVFFNGSPAAPGVVSTAGNADNTVPSALANQPYYVYIIGRDKASPVHYALVFSNNAPWAGGPKLDDTSFSFWQGGVPSGGPNYEGGWRYWRFIGCLIQPTAGLPWEIVTIRKIGNHVEYELEQLPLSHGTIGDSGWIKGSLATRVPPTSLRAFLECYVEGRDATQTMMLRPPGIPPANLVNMDLHDIPSANLSQEAKIQATSFAITPGLLFWNRVTGWVGLNENREVGFRHIAGGTDHNGRVFVLGYEEFDDVANTELTWP